MKMQFTLVIQGEDSLEKKFEKSIIENPTLHMDLIRSFGQTIMLALRLNEDDKISVESFRAGKAPDAPSQETQKPENQIPEIENKVDN